VAELWVVDSSAWIFALRRRPVEPIRQRVDELLAEGRALLTGMIELELLGGTRSGKEFAELEDLLGGLTRIETLVADWRGAAEMVGGLRRAGYTVPLTDALIAQQARRVGAGVIHADGDFVILCRRYEIEQQDFSRAVAGGKDRR
jgi:predicted nucleic acid-binding protein